MTIYDIAKEAGVSIATVSRVINNSDKVKHETYNKVKKILDRIQFQPNQLAVGLAKNITNTIGIMVPDIRDNFHASIAYLIESNLISYKYTCILCNTESQPEKKIEYLSMLYRKNVDGIILVGSSYNDDILNDSYERLQKKIPMVLINSIGTKDTSSVLCDEKYGIKKALEHLKERNKKHPIFLKDAQPHQINSAQAKECAFIDSFVETYGNSIHPLTFTINPDIKEYVKFLKDLKSINLSSPSIPYVDAILCSNDTNGAIVLKAMDKLNLRCPKDLAVIGFNNSFITDLTIPSMTSIDPEIETYCKTAVKKLFSLLKGVRTEKITYIKPTLSIKETT